MHQHQDEERGEVFSKTAAHNGQTADEMREGEKFLSGKLAIRPFIAEEHPHDGGNREGIKNQRLLPRSEP